MQHDLSPMERARRWGVYQGWLSAVRFQVEDGFNFDEWARHSKALREWAERGGVYEWGDLIPEPWLSTDDVCESSRQRLNQVPSVEWLLFGL